MNAPPTQPSSRNAIAAGGAMALLAAAVAWGGIALGVFSLRAWMDQVDYHLLVVEQFSRELPTPNLSDYRSATGPGYHLLLAVVHRFITPDVDVIRAVGATFTIALLGGLGWAVGRARGVRWQAAVALCLPALASMYVFSSGVWLLPDNLAWLTVLAALLIAFDGRANIADFIAAATVLAAAVFVRQINLWPLGVLVVGVMLADDDRSTLGPPLAPGAWRRGSLMLLTGIPALLILAWFYKLWHGLTPPAFQTLPGPLPPGHSSWEHEGPNFAVPAMVMAVLAATGAFFAGFLWPALRDVWANRRGQLAVVLIGAIVGAALALVVPTEFTPAPGPRYSGLWNVSARFPVVAHRSLFIAAMSAAGGAGLAMFFLALGRRDRWIWLASWACFAVAQSANAKAWHKYYEPFCLMMLALATARVIARRDGRVPRWAYAGPLLLAALLAAVTLSNLTEPPPAP